jgi:hypothetical protein
MIRKTLTSITALAAVAAIAPATAGATKLQSSPTLRAAEGGRIQLQFTTDKRLPVKGYKIATKISVNGKPVASLKRAGRHGRSFRYTALAAVGGMEVGKKYTVRFHFGSGTVTRQVKYLDTLNNG